MCDVVNIIFGGVRGSISARLKSHALVVTGIRRCGKSTLLAQFVRRLGLPYFYKELAVAAEITPTALNYYEKDKREPNVLILIRLAKALNITGGALLGLEPPPDMVTQSKNEFLALRALRTLNPTGQEKALNYISDLSELPKYTDKK